MLTQPKYVAKLGVIDGNRIVVYEAGSGALCAAIPCEVAEGDEAGETVKHTMTLIKKDGTVQTKTLDTLKTVFGWDGLDPFGLMDNSTAGAYDDIRFEITGTEKEGDKGGKYWGVDWLNPLGGSAKMPEPADRKSVLAKYGSKFRALAGGAPAKPAAKPATPPASKTPPVKKTPPAPQTGPTATMEECWEELCKANAGKSEDELSTLWFAEIEKMFPGKTNSDLSAHDWGKLKDSFDNVPV